MTIYIGVYFHRHRQTAAWCDTRNGEMDDCRVVRMDLIEGGSGRNIYCTV